MNRMAMSPVLECPVCGVRTAGHVLVDHERGAYTAADGTEVAWASRNRVTGYELACGDSFTVEEWVVCFAPGRVWFARPENAERELREHMGWQKEEKC